MNMPEGMVMRESAVASVATSSRRTFSSTKLCDGCMYRSSDSIELHSRNMPCQANPCPNHQAIKPSGTQLWPGTSLPKSIKLSNHRAHNYGQAHPCPNHRTIKPSGTQLWLGTPNTPQTIKPSSHLARNYGQVHPCPSHHQNQQVIFMRQRCTWP